MGDDDRYGHNHHGGGHRVPAGEPDYLTKAAEVLDRVIQLGPSVDTKVRIAGLYTLLGAIQRGVLPQEMAKELFDNVTKDRR